LRQPAQRELAHGERCRLRVALHPGRSAGEQDEAIAFVANLKRSGRYQQDVY
jgi:hypothetical protein